MRIQRTHALLTVLILVALPLPLLAAAFTDDFAAGIDPLFWRIDADPLFSVDDTHGDVRLSRPHGGDHTLQTAHVRYRGTAHGDFDISIAFRDAAIDQVDGLPGNQLQLNTIFGGQLFVMVRSDEPAGGGDNHHVYINPPGIWVGAGPDASTAGVMRIRRVGALVEGSIHGTVIYSGTFNAEPTTDISFSLQSNGTVDAISVTFDDFALTADEVTAVGAGPEGSWLTVDSPWPNPTTLSSQLAFALPAARPVTAAVYDPRGRLTRLLLSETVPAGPHSLIWDGRDASGRRAAAGVYFYRITAGPDTASRRVVIVR